MAWIAIAAALLTGAGTLTLAFFTWRLARSTKLDVEAQWRPLLVPCFHHRPAVSDVPMALQVRLGGWSGWANLSVLGAFEFAFENVGKGAALDVRGFVSNPAGKVVLFGQCGPLWSPVIAVTESA